MDNINISNYINNSANELKLFMEKLEVADAKLGINLSGKKLRGILTILISDILSGDKVKALEFASAVELIHLGSIEHDNIIDEHTTRRGVIPLNILKGTKFSVLTGDRLFALATRLGSKSGNKEAIEVSEAMESVLSGAIKEISIKEFISDIANGSAEDKFYYKMISLKTASLFKSAGRFGAMTYYNDKNGDNQSIIENFGDIGQDIGVAYQIADDLVDIIKMGEGKKELDIGSIISIIPAVFHYNKESAKTIPFVVLSGRLSIDKLFDLVSSVDMSGKMRTDIIRLLNKVDERIDNLTYKNEKTELLKLYSKYCINQILSEAGEHI